MKEYSEDEYLLLSGIQHFCFCRRQWALIHIEQQWFENVLTLEGDYIHEKSHNELSSERKGDDIISRGMPVASKHLGCVGACDVVEFKYDLGGINIFGRDRLYRPVPVEYKRGSPKASDADLLQLCAQAMCLEEMLVCDIEKGYLYYNEIRRRVEVIFDDNLRDKVVKMFLEMHDYYKRRHTPNVKPNKGCKSCSLANICLPKLLKAKSARTYINSILENDG